MKQSTILTFVLVLIAMAVAVGCAAEPRELEVVAPIPIDRGLRPQTSGGDCKAKCVSTWQQSHGPLRDAQNACEREADEAYNNGEITQEERGQRYQDCYDANRAAMRPIEAALDKCLDDCTKDAGDAGRKCRDGSDEGWYLPASTAPLGPLQRGCPRTTLTTAPAAEKRTPAVERTPERGRRSLLAGRQIDDAQAPMAERGLPVAVQARVVRSAMRDDVAHRARARGASMSSRSAATMPAMPHMTMPPAFVVAAARRAVDELPEPQLEHHQAPEPVTMILPARRGARCQSRRPRGRSKMPRSRSRPSSSRSSTIGASGPRSHSPIGAAKPCFGRSTIDARHVPLEQPAQQILAPAVLQLERRRHRGGELEQLVIEQRLARFERDRHAHLVDLGHDVVDEIGLDVDVQRAVERIRRRARVVARGGSWRTDRRRARSARSRASRAGAARVRLEHARRRACARRRRRAERQMPQRPRALDAERQRAGRAARRRVRRSGRASAAPPAPSARRDAARSRPRARRRRRPTAPP